jgi:hypothetical protein
MATGLFVAFLPFLFIFVFPAMIREWKDYQTARKKDPRKQVAWKDSQN